MPPVNPLHALDGGASPSLVRNLNAAAVLRVIRQSGTATRPEVVQMTGLSQPTVRSVIEELINVGYLRETLPDGDEQPRRPGPRPRVLSFRFDIGYVLGLDIGAKKVVALVADLEGRILATERRETTDARDAEALLAAAVDLARAVLDRAEVDLARLSAVAVGTPGVIDPVTGKVSLAPQLPGWEGMALSDRLAEELGCSCPVRADNEVHLAVLAERWRGVIQDADDALYVQIGVGIGCGVLIGGEIYRGSSGAAGEIGSLPLGDPDEPVADGMGSFEHAAGGTAFARLGRRAAAGPTGARLLELAGGDPAAVDSETVFAAAAEGDPAARGVVEELLGRLARGVAAAVVLLNPAVVVVGGGLSRAGEPLIDPLERSISALVPVPPGFALSALGDEAVALGAVRLALDTADQRLFAFELEAP